MNNMWKKFKDWIWQKEEEDEEAVEPAESFLQEALSRYCKDCDEFFKRSHSLTMHRRFKHKI